MRRRIRQIVMAGAILVAPMAMAQGEKRGHDKDPKAMADARTARMTETLALTPEQVQKVTVINQRHAEKMVSIRSQQDQDAKKASMMQLREWHQGELKNVLTAEQISKMEEMRKEMRSKSKGEHQRKHKGEHKGGERQQTKPADK